MTNQTQAKTWYTIENTKDTEHFHKEFENDQQAVDWVVNHLDLSKNWSVFRIKNNGE